MVSITPNHLKIVATPSRRLNLGFQACSTASCGGHLVGSDERISAPISAVTAKAISRMVRVTRAAVAAYCPDSHSCAAATCPMLLRQVFRMASRLEQKMHIIFLQAFRIRSCSTIVTDHRIEHSLNNGHAPNPIAYATINAIAVN